MSKRYRKELERYLKVLRKNKFYSAKRLDILVILISTSGILLITTVIKNDLKPMGLMVGLTLFALSIVINIITQVLSMESHSLMEKIYNQKLGDKNSFNEPKSRKERVVDLLNSIIIGFNYVGYIFLIFGILISIFSYTIS